jgi:hypothetical protein
MVRNQGKVTRFVVMAMLQAARAETLGLPRESAFSWGLNRAIFYAAAKRGFRGGTPSGTDGPKAPGQRPALELFRLGDDEALRDPTVEPVTFTIGERPQTVAEFDHAVSSRFGSQENFRKAWEEALRVVGSIDRAALESRQRFYEEVYRPHRDELSDAWSRKYSPPAKGA